MFKYACIVILILNLMLGVVNFLIVNDSNERIYELIKSHKTNTHTFSDDELIFFGE